MVFGERNQDRNILEPPVESQFLKPDHLFPGKNLVLVCLANEVVSLEKLRALPIPISGSQSSQENMVVVTYFHADEFRKQVLDNEHVKVRSIEISDKFKAGLIDLGIISYAGVVLSREE